MWVEVGCGLVEDSGMLGPGTGKDSALDPTARGRGFMQRGELRRVGEDKPEDPPKKPCTCQRFLSREQEDEGAVGSRPHCAWVEGAVVGLLSVLTLGQWLVQVPVAQEPVWVPGGEQRALSVPKFGSSFLFITLQR